MQNFIHTSNTSVFIINIIINDDIYIYIYRYCSINCIDLSVLNTIFLIQFNIYIYIIYILFISCMK